MGSTPEGLGKKLILASASIARAEMLRAVGLVFDIEPAAIDEASIKRTCRNAGDDAATCAMTLAKAKARAVARRHPNGVVIGADQILVADNDWFDKPANLDEARTQLLRLSGSSHKLATAACAYRGAECLWQTTSIPELTMRHFGEDFLAHYIAAEGEALLGSVGGYRLEGRGALLFSRIDGDYHAILGLPLIELLGFLRRYGLLEE